MRVSKVNARASLEPGARVGDHLIIQAVLGKGGTAVVFEALHTRLSCSVALKVVTVDADFADDAAVRLTREASVCAALEDEHIAKVFDMGALPDGRPYMVMEKVSGPTLEELLDAGHLSMRLTLDIVSDLLRALEAVHGIDVVHRDVKPANLIIQRLDTSAPRVRLMDFGVSKSMSRETADPAITRQGALVGTPHYMAPEQISDEGVDGRTDLYAAGVVLYEMLTGQLPFEGRSTAEVMAAVLRHAYVPLHEALPFAPKGLCAIVAQALAERPMDRFASAREMREAIEAFVLRLDRGETLPPPEAREMRAPRTTTPHSWAVATLCSVSLAGLLAIGSRQNSGDDRHALSPHTDLSAHTAALRANGPSRDLPHLDAAPTPVMALPEPPSAANRAGVAEPVARRTARRARTEVTDPVVIIAPGAPSKAGLVVSDYLRDLDALMVTESEELGETEAAEPTLLPPNPFQM